MKWIEFCVGRTNQRSIDRSLGRASTLAIFFYIDDDDDGCGMIALSRY